MPTAINSNCDHKGYKIYGRLYKKARAGEIQNFTGIDAPYEAPINPDLMIDTAKNDIETYVQEILTYVENHVYIKNS